MRGIDKFKERFAGHDGEYVLIGGGACDLLFGEAGQDFRATKDLDLVLLVEALTPEFGQVFWDFVKEGGYENRQKSSGRPQFYRFSKPEDPAFPAIDPAQPFPLEADHIHPSPEPSQKDPEQSWCGNASHGYASRTLRRTPGAPGVDR